MEIVATVRRKNRKIFGEIFFSEDFYGISARGKKGIFLSSVRFFYGKAGGKNLQFFTNKHFFLNKKGLTEKISHGKL